MQGKLGPLICKLVFKFVNGIYLMKIEFKLTPICNSTGGHKE